MSTRVSIVVAVYNRETLIDRCIDSLVYQSCVDNYEIILVDDFSTDNSLRIMNEWAERFPEKIRVFSNVNKGGANAKNFGVAKARGTYITFVDSDDYVSYDALRILLSAVGESDPEIVVSPILRISNSGKQILGSLNISKHPTWTIQEHLLAGEYFFLPGKLIRADLFSRYGMLPILGVSEDVSWMFPVLTKVEDVRYIDKPIYYYEYSSNSITISGPSDALTTDAISAMRLILENSSAQWRGHTLRYALSRAIGFVAKRYPASKSTLVPIVRDLIPEVDESEFFADNYPSFSTKLKSFVDDYVEDELESCVNSWSIIRSGDIQIPPKSNMPRVVAAAYDDGNVSFVEEWAAVRELVLFGGMYLHNDIIQVSELNDVSCFDSIVVYSGDEKVISPKVFACRAKNPLFADILSTYEDDEICVDCTLADRIRMVAVGRGCMPIVGSRRYINDSQRFAALPAESFLWCPPGVNDVAVYTYDSTLSALQEGCLSQTYLKSVFDRINRNFKFLLNREKRRYLSLNRQYNVSQTARKKNWLESQRLMHELSDSQRARRYNWKEARKLEQEIEASQKARRINWEEVQILSKKLSESESLVQRLRAELADAQKARRINWKEAQILSKKLSESESLVQSLRTELADAQKARRINWKEVQILEKKLSASVFSLTEMQKNLDDAQESRRISLLEVERLGKELLVSESRIAEQKNEIMCLSEDLANKSAELENYRNEKDAELRQCAERITEFSSSIACRAVLRVVRFVRRFNRG